MSSAIAHNGIDLTGKRFGKWLVLGDRSSDGHSTTYLCRCDCGTKRRLRSSDLRGGKSTSCGCAPRARPKDDAPACTHCKARPTSCGRLLCWVCRRDPEVCERYRSTPQPWRDGESHPLPEPTDTAPRTEERIRVYIERAERRQQLFHPGDNRGEGEQPPSGRKAYGPKVRLAIDTQEDEP